MAQRRQVLGFEVDTSTERDVVALAIDAVKERRRFVHLSLNATKVVAARHDSTLRQALAQADSVGADGIGVVIGAGLGWSGAARCTGIGVFEGMMAHAAANGQRVAILGGKPAVTAQASRLLNERGVDVVFAHHGYFRPADERAIAEQIDASNADILVVALGSPASEYWLWRHQAAIPVQLVVGGSLDVLVGQVQRAPKWVGNVGLEWLYRVCREPRKRFWTGIVSPSRFVLAMSADLARRMTNRRLQG